MTYSYALFGLTVSLPFPCPYLSRIETNLTHDVTVGYGTVPKELAGAAASDDTWKFGFCWQAAPNRFLLRGGMRSGRFLVEGGNRVTLYRNAHAEDDRLLFHLLHPVIAALFRQRGFLVLHASTANTPSGATALCGRSGAGKSTTLAAMLQCECGVISDDITVLRFGASGFVEVNPGTTMMHLWDDAVLGVGLNPAEFGRHSMRRGKAVLSAPGEPCRRPVRLQRLCILEPGEGDEIRVLRLRGSDKFDALLACVYGPFFREEHPGLFELFSATAEQVEIFRIQRPVGRWTVDHVAGAVLHG